MSQPRHGLGYQIRHVAVLIRSFAWDHVPKDGLGRRTSDHEALDNVAFDPLLFERLVAGLVACELELVSQLHTALRDVEVVEPDNRDR